MPGITVGRYPGQQTAGTQVSSTYEGRHLTVLETEMIHPFRASGFVNTGDPVVVCDAGVPATYGNIVGVAFITATALTDYIALDTEGIFNLTVYAEDDIGNSAIEIGDCLYIRAGSLTGAASADGLGDAEISKMNDAAHQVFFGYALGSMVAGGSGVIAVKVHASPFPEMEERRYQTVATGAYSYGFHETAILAAGESTGLHYKDARVGGQQTGGIYAHSVWMELQADFLHLDDNLLVMLEGGIYEATSLAADNWIIGLQLQYQLAGNPNRLDHFRVNIAAAGGACHCIMAAANPESVGFAVGEAGQGVTGTVPMFDIVGHGVMYVDCHNASA